jgi:hypothetical protein
VLQVVDGLVARTVPPAEVAPAGGTPDVLT